MMTTKQTLSNLFFIKMNKHIYDKKHELEKPVDFDLFYSIMVDACKICNDMKILDKTRLDLLYNAYVDTFNKNKYNFKSLFRQTRNIKSDIVFGELLPSTKTVTNLAYYKNRCYLNAEELLKTRQCQTSLESFIKKYGENEGQIKYNDFSEKRKQIYANKDAEFKEQCKARLCKCSRLHKEYYLDKTNPATGKLYTEAEIVTAISEHQKCLSHKSAEKRKERNEKYHDVSCRQINYWLNKGYSYEKSVEKVRQIQATNTVEHYVEKYGYERGIEEWQKRNAKWGNTMCELKSKSGKSGNAYSKAACALFDTVIEKLKEYDIVFEHVYYGETEFSKWDKTFNRVYFYDFVINDIKLCVEYNGIMFHPKEGNYNWKCLYSGTTYEEAIAYDKRKQQLIQDLGYDLIIIWEDDIFEKSVETIIDKCKTLFIKTK